MLKGLRKMNARDLSAATRYFWLIMLTWVLLNTSAPIMALVLRMDANVMSSGLVRIAVNTLAKYVKEIFWEIGLLITVNAWRRHQGVITARLSSATTIAVNMANV